MHINEFPGAGESSAYLAKYDSVHGQWPHACAFEDGHVVGLDPDDPIQVSYGERIDPSPSGKEARDTLRQDWSQGHNSTIVNGVSRIGWMTGGEKARWVDEDMADVFTRNALAFLDKSAAKKDTPFFLFFSTAVTRR